ncbi:MAG: two-component sensor histidine kinase [Deltaproteobacteria bacterium]|nr:MAG: two-component sensor histidine kinase [Deltaproteobacteria bacterium]
MSFARVINFPRTLSFRLTLWYGIIFTLSCGLAFIFFYILITTTLKQRLDDRLSEKLSEFEAIYNLQGLDEVKAAALIESQTSGEKKVFFRLLYASGVAFSSSNMSYWQAIGVNRNAVHRLIAGHTRAFETLTIPGRQERVRIAYGVIGKGIVVQLGYTMENDTAFIVIFKKMFFVIMSVLMITAVLVGWFMARRALSGVEAVTRTARQISVSDLGRRVPIMSRHEEIDRLAVTFNQMLDRIEELIDGIREMGDNIAHDLKSPIARIRGMAEIGLGEADAKTGELDVVGSIIEECDRLLDMIDTMLMISKTDAGTDEIAAEPVDIADIVRDAAALFAPLAEDQGVRITCDMPDCLMVEGDRKLLQRVIANLLDNAIKYTPTPGTIDISAIDGKSKDSTVNVSIKDTGVGIHPDNLPRIFDRFFRCDQSRSTEGAGLGLSLARSVARSHGGDILADSRLGKGSVFTLRLPRIRTGTQ